jgi:DNA-binding MarR family transcriptional regulator
MDDVPGGSPVTLDSVPSQADVLMAASRVFVAISTESLDAGTADVDLLHFRVLVVIASHDGMSLGELADAARIHPSRASRVCDSLVGAGLVTRVQSVADRRQVVLRVTAAGQKVVDRVWTERKRAMIRVLSNLDDERRAEVVAALRLFVEAAGARSDHALWASGWAT